MPKTEYNDDISGVCPYCSNSVTIDFQTGEKVIYIGDCPWCGNIVIAREENEFAWERE